MKTITATFTGINGSLGYTTGQSYKLNIQNNGGAGIRINRLDGKLMGTCDYRSFITFLDNWSSIKVVGKFGL